MRFTQKLQNERGAVLITGLLLLLLLTVFALTGLQGTTLQERMAGNQEQSDLAFQAAEAGLRNAENYLYGLSILPSFDNSNGLYIPADPGDTPRWDSIDWSATSSNSIEYQGNDLENAPYSKPRYIIEYLTALADPSNDSVKFGPKVKGLDMLRVTSRGVSPNGRSVSMLQTTYLR